MFHVVIRLSSSRIANPSDVVRLDDHVWVKVMFYWNPADLTHTPGNFPNVSKAKGLLRSVADAATLMRRHKRLMTCIECEMHTYSVFVVVVC